MRKLRSLKASLKGWNKQVFGNLNFQIEYLSGVIKDLDLLADQSPISDEDMDYGSKVFVDLLDILSLKDSKLLCRFNYIFLKKGDANSCFFHAFIQSMSKRNYILALKVGDNWVEGLAGILLEIFNYFSDKFRDSNVY